jgi:hypothetical protein
MFLFRNYQKTAYISHQRSYQKTNIIFWTRRAKTAEDLEVPF